MTAASGSNISATIKSAFAALSFLIAHYWTNTNTKGRNLKSDSCPLSYLCLTFAVFRFSAYATSYFNIKRVMSCIVILLLVGLGMNEILNKLESAALKWRKYNCKKL